MDTTPGSTGATIASTVATAGLLAAAKAAAEATEGLPAIPPSQAPAPLPAPVPAIPASALVTTFKSTETTTVKPTFWQGMIDDIHVRASGLFIFVCLGVGVFYPELKPKMTELVALAATYLFGSAVTK